VSRLRVIILALIASGVTAYVAVQLLTTERERVARVVQRMARRIEKRDAAGFCLCLAEDYRDSNGHNRASLRELLSRGLPYLTSVSVALTEVQIAVQDGEPKTARAEFEGSVAAQGQGRQGLEPWRWRSRVRLHLRKLDGEWRVAEADYRMPDGLRVE
jgi:hypothetical protein